MGAVATRPARGQGDTRMSKRLALPFLLLGIVACTAPVEAPPASETCEGCTSGQRCVDGRCVASGCDVVGCPEGTRCTPGGCVSDSCDEGVCDGGVCDGEACVEPACLGVRCAAGPCVGGRCPADACGDAGPCDDATACVDGRCIDARCVGVSCGAGLECVAGDCVAGCTPTAATESSCTDGRDDDCDGLVDCADPDCEGVACASDGKACTTDVCSAGVCAHPMAPQGTVCRASVGGCDAAEACTGASASCPADAFDASCTCPERGPLAGFTENGGPRAITADRFVLKDSGTWAAWAQAIDALGLPTAPLATLPLNRQATPMPTKSWPGFGAGFQWASGDLTVPYWVPQGLTGGSAGGRKYTVVGWHYDETLRDSDPSPAVDGADKGSRVSFADVSDMSAVTYRHVMLAQPDATRGFKPITFHAGGLAWSGTNLYIADTSRGVRVFDLTRILEVSTAAECATRMGVSNGVACAYGYAYVLPQVATYAFPSGLGDSCRPKFSFIALDRGTSPPSLLSGEYDNDPALGLYGRLVRWPLEPGTGRLVTGPTGVVTATGAWYAGSRNLQGAVSSGGRFYMNATRYSGALFIAAPGTQATVLRADQGQWGWMVEGAHLSASGNLWNSTEGHANLPRSVFYVHLSALP